MHQTLIIMKLWAFVCMKTYVLVACYHFVFAIIATLGAYYINMHLCYLSYVEQDILIVVGIL